MKRYALASFALFVLAFSIASAPARAGSATVSWANPTQNVDGSAIPASGPGSIASTRVEVGTCSGSAFGTRVTETIVPAPATSVTIDNLAPGALCFRAFSRNTFGQESAASNVAAKTIPTPVPNPPTISTIAVVAGLNRAPLYRINADGSRGSVVIGFVPVGAACTGPVVFTYRGASYRRVDPAVPVQWWGTAPTTSAAAPCA